MNGGTRAGLFRLTGMGIRYLTLVFFLALIAPLITSAVLHTKEVGSVYQAPALKIVVKNSLVPTVEISDSTAIVEGDAANPPAWPANLSRTLK